MFDISTNGIISITRGDAARTSLYINLGTALDPLYSTLSDNQKLYFGIMEPNQAFEDSIVRKVLTKADHCDPDDPLAVVITFNCEDTVNLLPGTYYYSAKLYTDGGFDGPDRVDTLIPKTKFVILD